MNIANKLTLLRIFLIPVFLYFLLGGQFAIAGVLFIIASLTDFLDGYLARKYDLITKLGKLMDPLADKLLVLSAFIGFVEIGLIPSWIVIVITSRELIVSIFRAVAASEGIVIAASWWGKLKTNAQMFALIFLMFPMLIPSIVATITLYLAAILTLISGIDYLWQNRAVLRETP